jgi:hypothetical protein
VSAALPAKRRKASRITPGYEIEIVCSDCGRARWAKVTSVQDVPPPIYARFIAVADDSPCHPMDAGKQCELFFVSGAEVMSRRSDGGPMKLTPTDIDLLRAVAGLQVHHRPQSAGYPACDVLRVPGQRPRTVTARMRRLRQAGLATRKSYDYGPWTLTDAGHACLEIGGGAR